MCTDYHRPGGYHEFTQGYRFFPGARNGREGGQGTEEGYKEGTEMSDPSSQLGEDEQEGWERDSEAAVSGAGDTGHLTVKGSQKVSWKKEQQWTDGRTGVGQISVQVPATTSGHGLDGQDPVEENLLEMRESRGQSPACWMHNLDTLGQ